MKYLRTALRLIPVVGAWFENRESKDMGKGNIDAAKVLTDLARLAVAVGTTLLL